MRCARVGLLAVAALMFFSLPLVPAVAVPKAGDLQIVVTSVSPLAPAASAAGTALTIAMTVTNTSSAAVDNVQITATRTDPIGTQAALDSSLKAKSTSAGGRDIPATRASTFSLAAGAAIRTTFVTNASLLDDGKGLCLCYNNVYPIALDAVAGGQVLSSVTTYVTSIFQKLSTPVKVAWVWPLIDRPHRVFDENVFTDDSLTAEVASGGTLDRSLQVLETASTGVPMTAVVDPELLDELEVMSTGAYTVRPIGSKVAHIGAGRDAAAAWLTRFTALVTSRPSLAVALTPFADPDVRTLADKGLSWRTGLTATMSPRVAAALGGRTPQNSFAWPPSNSLDQATLTALTRTGTTSVLIDSSSVTPGQTNGVPDSLTRIGTTNSGVNAAMTSPSLQAAIARSVAEVGGTGSAELPALTAGVAIRAIQDPTIASVAILSPPRYVDPNVQNAVAAIQATTSSSFATPTALTDLVSTNPNSSSRIRATGAVDFPTDITNTVTLLNGEQNELQSLLGGVNASIAAKTLLSAVPTGIQRLTSAAWRSGVGPYGPAYGRPLAKFAADQIDGVLTGVHIVKPSSGSYTLASSNSRLPITVENLSVYPVLVAVEVRAVNSLPGYTTRNVGVKAIAPGQRIIVQVPSRLERTARIAVQAQLRTPNGTELGDPVRLYVHSTVFGVVGVLITVVAGGVLVLALLFRFSRQMRARRRKRYATSAVGAAG